MDRFDKNMEDHVSRPNFVNHLGGLGNERRVRVGEFYNPHTYNSKRNYLF